MKQKLDSLARSAALPVLLLACSAALNAQAAGGPAGLSTAMNYLVSIVSWLRNAALLIFVIALIWGCIECAVESWREGRPRIIASIVCAIIAGVAQAFIGGIYSANG